MWNEGTLLIEGTTVKYWVKALDEKSEAYGIEGSRIIKMTLKINGEWTLNYDRGWDIEPEDEVSQLAYAALLKKFG
ncbi:DUF7678 domain-containing protein [Lactimicrobium massiliense]|uniref:DUF7678 domain-containing protein n=1 Tax=Lactimicrobium massiliense TaxID=2161814 RepID=UPI000D54C6D5|nr:hypothetical protein [Lactimicrobium massiliense]